MSHSDEFTIRVPRGQTLDRFVVVRRNNRPEDLSTVTLIRFLVKSRQSDLDASAVIDQSITLVVAELTCGEIHVELTTVQTLALSPGTAFWQILVVNADTTVDRFPSPSGKFIVEV